MANLKNTNIDNNLELPSGTTGERPSSPQEGQIRYNTDLETAEFWNGSNWRPLSDTNPATIEDLDLVVNGTFDTDTTGWSLINVGQDTATVQNGRVTVNCGNSAGYVLYQIVPTVIGKQYRISFDVIGSSNGWSFEINNQSGSDYIDTRNNLSTGTFSYTITANTTTTSLTLGANNGVFNTSAIFDNVSMREVGDSTIVDTDTGGVPYRIHYFTDVGTSTFTVTNPGEVEVLIVGGGGAGQQDDVGGGGGAGGLIYRNIFVTPQTYTIEVGAGGNRNTSRGSRAQNGSASSAFGLTALGGGAGGGDDSGSANGEAGGSGGGAGYDNGSGGSALQPSSQSGGFGNPGGSGGIRSGPNYPTGGGGGAVNQSGNGLISRGGLGGGGRGAAPNAVEDNPEDGLPNTGGGGGGENVGSFGGAGGSGIVIVRYPKNSNTSSSPDRTISFTQPDNIQLIKEDLVLHLDAGNPLSYPGSGDTWYDLSPFGHHADLIGSPVFTDQNGGSFEFSASSEARIQSSSIDSAFSSMSEWTIMWVFRSLESYDETGWHTISSFGDSENFLDYWQRTDTRVFTDNGAGVDTNIDLTKTGLNFWASYTDSSNNVEIFRNNTSVATGTNSRGGTSSPNDFVIANRPSGGYSLQAIFLCCLVYKKALSEQQIRNNYVYFRGRFG
jgi:hypothetical protein